MCSSSARAILCCHPHSNSIVSSHSLPFAHPRNVPSSGSLHRGERDDNRGPTQIYVHTFSSPTHICLGLPMCVAGHPADLAVPLRKSLDSLMPVPCLSPKTTSPSVPLFTFPHSFILLYFLMCELCDTTSVEASGNIYAAQIENL